MNTRVVCVSFLALAFSAGLFAQATNQQVVDPASKEDVQKVGRAISDLQGEVEKRSVAARNDAEERQEKELQAIDAAKVEIARQNAEREKAWAAKERHDKDLAAEEAKLREAKIMRMIYGVIVVVIALIVSLVVSMRSKRTALPAEPRVANIATTETIVPIVSDDNAATVPLLNPEIETITAIAKRNGGIAAMTLQYDGDDERYNCIFRIRDEDSNDRVQFIDHKKTVRWTERFNFIKALKRQKASVAVS